MAKNLAPPSLRRRAYVLFLTRERAQARGGGEYAVTVDNGWYPANIDSLPGSVPSNEVVVNFRDAVARIADRLEQRGYHVDPREYGGE